MKSAILLWVCELFMLWMTMLRVVSGFSNADFNDSSDIDMSNILKNMKSLYEYNVFLREKLLSTQSEVRALATKSAL